MSSIGQWYENSSLRDGDRLPTSVALQWEFLLAGSV